MNGAAGWVGHFGTCVDVADGTSDVTSSCWRAETSWVGAASCGEGMLRPAGGSLVRVRGRAHGPDDYTLLGL